jgi:drug/metabolite transporter (DMT)-like permease
MLAALAGVGLVITRGSLSLITSGQVGIGDLMILLGVLCWVVYMLGASSLPSWSPLRYTTLSALAGTVTIVAITAVATALGYVAAPSFHQTAGVAWEIAYMILPGTVVTVLTWNAGIKRLGPQNTVLFINLVPVITLAIEIARGYQVLGIELVGVVVTVLALTGNNLWQRRTASQPKPPAESTERAAA